MSCDSAHLEGDDERVTCEWSNVSADDAWDVVDDDPDEQDIRHVGGGDNEPHDSESDIAHNKENQDDNVEKVNCTSGPKAQ